MGMNYFWCVDICATCGRAGSLVHVGKQCAEWAFLFRALTGGESDILDRPLNSAAAWRGFMADSDGALRDDAGEDVPQDEFWALVEKTKGRKNTVGVARSEYLDSEGYALSWRAFS